MFAIVKLGNQQFKVKAGDFIRVPYQKVSPGDEIEIPVLGFSESEGEDFVFTKEDLKKSKVKAVLLRQALAKKVLVFKKKRRKGYRKTRGYRQKLSELKVLELCSPSGKISKVDIKKVSSKKAITEDKVESKNASTKTKSDQSVEKSSIKKDKPKKRSHKQVKKQSERQAGSKEATKKASKETDKKVSAKKNCENREQRS